jgi:hypothetical protein
MSDDTHKKIDADAKARIHADPLLKGLFQDKNRRDVLSEHNQPSKGDPKIASGLQGLQTEIPSLQKRGTKSQRKKKGRDLNPSQKPHSPLSGPGIDDSLLSLSAKIGTGSSDYNSLLRAKAGGASKEDLQALSQPSQNHEDYGVSVLKNGKKSKYDLTVDSDIELSLRYRIPKKLAKTEKAQLKKLGTYISEQIYMALSERQRYMQNLYLYRESWMNFERTGLEITIDGQHDVHIPLVFEKGKAMYARLVNAVLGVEPFFNCRPRKPVSEKCKQSKEDLMRWVMTNYANKMKGVKHEVDKDCWNFILDGTSITKHWWAKDVRKFSDVIETEMRPLKLDSRGNIMFEEKEIERQEVVYDGPMMKTVPLEDIVLAGTQIEDVNDADLLAHIQGYTKSDLIKLAQQGFFFEDAINYVIETRQPTTHTILETHGQERYLKLQKDVDSGIRQQYSASGIPFYTVYETYLRYDIDEDGIDEELVVWIEKESQRVLRITYLDRVSPSGKRPFVFKRLIPREGKPYGIGFAEMLYGLQNIKDYIVNQRLDAGTFQIFPWFVYRSGSAFNATEMKIGPGKGIPVDDINDLSFPKVNGNPAYGFQEEQAVSGYADGVTGVTPMAMGQQQGQGATRTATGSAAIVNELNTNLDIYIKHYQWGFEQNLQIIDKQIEELLPLGLEYRVLGVEGNSIYKKFEDRQSLKFDTDYELVGNTVNSNKAIERDTATQLLQVLQNPIALQSGLVTPQNLYAVYKNYLQKVEIRDVESYLTKPGNMPDSIFSAKDEINMILAGVKPPIVMNDRHQEKLAYFDEFEKSPEFALYSEDHLPLYLETRKGHENYASAIKSQAPLAGMGGEGQSPMLAAQLAAGAGNPQGGVPNQIQDLLPKNTAAQSGSTPPAQPFGPGPANTMLK